MTPAAALFGLLAITAIATSAQIFGRLRQIKRLGRLAQQLQMHYSRDDRFKLARRFPSPLPQPGACDLRIIDVLFFTQHHRHLYLFTIQYSLGALTGVRRLARAAAVSEQVRRGLNHNPPPGPITLAPENLRLIQQYQFLHDQAIATGFPPKT